MAVNVAAAAVATAEAASETAASVAARRQLRRAWRGHVRRNQPARAVRSVCRCLMTLKEPRVHVRTISCLSTQLEVLGPARGIHIEGPQRVNTGTAGRKGSDPRVGNWSGTCAEKWLMRPWREQM